MAVPGNGSKMPDAPRPNGAQKPLPNLPAPAAQSKPPIMTEERRKELREKFDREKAERDAKAQTDKKPGTKLTESKKPDDKKPAEQTPAEADHKDAPALGDATMRRFAELMAAGGFTRRLSWRQRRALRRVERRCDRVRTALHEAFDGAPPEGVLAAMDSLAALEAVARLEMLCEPPKK